MEGEWGEGVFATLEDIGKWIGEGKKMRRGKAEEWERIRGGGSEYERKFYCIVRTKRRGGSSEGLMLGRALVRMRNWKMKSRMRQRRGRCIVGGSIPLWELVFLLIRIYLFFSIRWVSWYSWDSSTGHTCRRNNPFFFLFRGPSRWNLWLFLSFFLLFIEPATRRQERT